MVALNKVTRKLGELQGTYNANQAIGQTSGLWQGMWDSPFATIGLLLGNGIEKGISIGIPFVLGLWMQEFIKASATAKTNSVKQASAPIQ